MATEGMERREVDKAELAVQGGEGMDRVEAVEKMEEDRFEEDRLKGGRAEVDKEKRGYQVVLLQAEVYRVDHIESEASQKQWECQ